MMNRRIPCPSGRKLARRLSAGAALGLALWGTRWLRAQENPTLPQGPTLKVTSNVVNVYAVVKDRKGHLISNLNKDDFEITDNNAPQEIRYFTRMTDTPLTLGIMVDTSPSQRRVLDVEKQEAEAFLRQVLRPKDMAFVLHFDVEVELLQDFTASQQSLAHAIEECQINGGGVGVLPSPLPSGDPGGATHLYDAIYLAANELMKNEIGRKVLILLTDGEDQGSSIKLDRALEAAQKTDLMIYSVAIIDRSFYWGNFMGFGGDAVLKKLSDETGGRVIEVNRVKDTSAAFQQIADELRTQYLLGYAPPDFKADGSYHKIQVRVKSGGYKVQARRGYYAPTQ